MITNLNNSNNTSTNESNSTSQSVLPHNILPTTNSNNFSPKADRNKVHAENLSSVFQTTVTKTHSSPLKNIDLTPQLKQTRVIGNHNLQLSNSLPTERGNAIGNKATKTNTVNPFIS